MKKSSKGLILLGTAAIAISMGGTSQITTKINRNVEKQNIQTYNHNPANILDNIFIENNKRILPFIFSSVDQTVSVEKIKDEFKKAGLTVKNISTPKIGTGTTITVEENNDIYTVLIYGDVNNDGDVDITDIQRIILHYLKGNILDDITLTAANVSNDDAELDITDIQRLIIFYLGGNLDGSLVVNEPGSIKDAPVITLKGNNPQIIKYGANYTEAGATATDKSGKTVTVQTSGTINTNTLGEQYITYTAKDSKGNTGIATRKVIVKDYATDVRVTKQPNKTSYQVGESLDLTGGEITITYASNAKETILMTNCKASGSTSTAGSKTITVSYENTKLFEPATTTFTINVTGGTVNPPVTTGIRLDTSNMRTNYAEGETISTDGLKVYAQKDNNTESLLDNSQVNITCSEITAITSGKLTITVTYGTFSESVEVTITVSRPVSKIVPSKLAEKGNKYQNIEITLSSGEGEADLVATELDYDITKDGGVALETDIEVKFEQNGSNVKMTVNAKQLGNYTITPKLKTGSVDTTAITVDINKDNLKVTDIEFNIPETTKITKGKDFVTIPIKFIHTYTGITDDDEISVMAKDVWNNITKTEGLEVEVWKETQGNLASKIEDPETSEEFVKYIAVKAATAGKYSLTITKDEGSITKEINVQEPIVEISADMTNLPLYLEVPDDVTVNLFYDDVDEIVYTLIGITLEEDKNEIELDETKLSIKLQGTDGTMTDLRPALLDKLFKADKITEVTNGKDIKYIGIAAPSTSKLNAANGKKVIISYEGAESPIELTIDAIIPEKTVKTIVPSKLAEKGNKYQNIEITLSSGEGEADLVATELDYDITKDSGVALETDIEVKFEQNGSNVKMTVNAKQLGNYIITPKLKTGSVNTTAITVDINKDNLKVTDIEFNIPETTKITKGKDFVTIPIKFIHTYTEATDDDEISVMAKDVWNNITKTEGLEVEVWKETQGNLASKIEDPETSEEIVKYIAVKAATAGKYSLTITKDEGSITKEINVQEPIVEISADMTNLPLYLEVPTDVTVNLFYDDVDEIVYTLIGITLKEDGNEIEIDETKLSIKLQGTDGTMTDLRPALLDKLLKADKITEVTNGKDIKYIGIAAPSTSKLNAANGKKVIISYEGAETPIELTIVAN